ncbi:MAG: hypothetical protein R3240_06540, partial [Gammaproteobacteria bacterium]|nr:hypothetical protein [Gammaproteobacteria bacterium]
MQHWQKLIFILLLLGSQAAYCKTEPWYLLTGFGNSDNYYPSKTEDYIDKVTRRPIATRMMAAEFELGAYLPGKKFPTLHGITLQYAYDSPVYLVREPRAKISVSRYTLSYSLMQFLSDYPGWGLYLRGDAGLGGRWVTYHNNYIAEHDSYNAYGLHLLAGMGYGVRLSSESRGLFEFNYSTIRNSSNNSRALMFVL